MHDSSSKQMIYSNTVTCLLLNLSRLYLIHSGNLPVKACPGSRPTDPWHTLTHTVKHTHRHTHLHSHVFIAVLAPHVAH